MGHLFLLMNMEPLQGTELCLKSPMNFQKSPVAGRDWEEQDKSSQGPCHSWAMDRFVPQFFFPSGGSVFLRFLAGGHFSEIIFVPQQKKTGVGNITLHVFSSKSSANCDLDEIKLVVLLSSLSFFF